MNSWYAVVVYHEHNGGTFYGVLRSYSSPYKAHQYAKRCNRFLKHIGSKYVISVSQQS